MCFTGVEMLLVLQFDGNWNNSTTNVGDFIWNGNNSSGNSNRNNGTRLTLCYNKSTASLTLPLGRRYKDAQSVLVVYRKLYVQHKAEVA